MLTCVCCGQWRLEEVLLDRQRGAGVQRFYRLWRTRPELGDWMPVTTFHTIDEVADGLEARGIDMLIEPDDGCE